MAARLRREGPYQSQIRRWTEARDALNRDATARSVPRRAHRAKSSGVGQDEAARLRAENQRLTRELAKSQAVVEIMGKLQGLLEGTPTSSKPR